MNNLINLIDKILISSSNGGSHRGSHRRSVESSRALMLISIKNNHYLDNLGDKSRLSSLYQDFIEILNKEIKGYLVADIFEFGGHIYCVLNSNKQLHNLAFLIRNTLNTKSGISVFLDVRVSACSLIENSRVKDAILFLRHKIDYPDQNVFFSYTDNLEKEAAQIRGEFELLSEFESSIHQKTSCFAFQPIIQCKTGEVAYHECLLRLNKNDHKLVSAGSYIAVAEKYGFILDVDKYVFEMAVKELLSTSNVFLSVNISRVGIQDKLVSSYILDLIEKSNVGHRMIIEFTETAINHDPKAIKYFAERAKSLGCKIAIDDFGVGYTSLSELKNFSIDIIKIDGSIVRNLGQNSKNKVLVNSIILVAQDLGCKTVAEFVENGVIAKELIEMNVDYMQGHFFSPALNYRTWSKK